MIRRCLYIAFVVVVPLAVVLLAGRSIVLRDQWAKRRLHELLTVQAAQTLGAEVRVGDIQGHILTGLKIVDLAISEGTSLAESTVVSADEVSLKYDLWPVIRRETPPIESVEEVRIVGLRGKLSRDRDGRLNIQRFLDLRKPSKEPPKARFKGRIIIEDAEIRYADEAASPAFLRGLYLHVANINARADFARPGRIEYEIGAEGFQAPFDRLEADGAVGLARTAVSVHATITGADVPALYQRFAASPALEVTSGLANAEVSACLIPGELVDYAVVGHAYGLAAAVAALNGERIAGSGDFTVTPAGVRLPAVNLAALGSTISGEGAIFDFASPTIDVEATARGVDLQRWAELVPEVREALPEITGAEGVRIAARVTGPLATPDIRVAAEFPSEVTVGYQLPRDPADEQSATEAPVLTAAGRGLRIVAAVPDLQTRDVKARVSVQELDVGDLGVLLPEQDYLRQVTASPFRELSVGLVYSREAPATAGRLAIERVETEHGPVEGLDIQYALADKTIRASVFADSVLGAEMSAEGLIDFSDSPPAIYAEFDADAVDAAKVAAIAGFDDLDLSGRLAASGVAAIAGQEVEAAARVTGQGLALRNVRFDRATANVGLTRDALDVRYLDAAGPLGTVWARGRMPFEGPIDAEIAAADVSLEQIQTLIEDQQTEDEEVAEGRQADQGVEPLRARGAAYLHGWVNGELKAPEIRADLAAFGVGADEWAAPVATATVTGNPHELRVSDALVRRGTAVASAEVALTDIVWPPGSYFSDEEALPEGSEAEATPLDGTLAGSARLTGLDLSQLGDFLSLPDGLLVAGVAEARGLELGGTLSSPTIGGDVSVSHGKVALTEQDLAVGPLTLDAAVLADRNALAVRTASLASNAGDVELSAELSGWNAEEGPQVSGAFSARKLQIGAYTPTEGALGELRGTIDSIEGKVAGPLSEPWPTISAEVAAERVAFGRREIRDITATLFHDNGIVGGRRVRCEAAGGEIAVPAASYRLEDGKLFADARIGALDAQELLFWVADLASQGGSAADAGETRDKLYALAHRLRGHVSADKLMVGGWLGDLTGKVGGLRTEGARLDRKPIPDLMAACDFSGLAPVPAQAGPDSPQTDTPSPLAHLHADNIAVTSDVHGGSLTIDGSVHWDGDVDVTAEANLVPVSAFEAWLPAGMAVGGELALTARASGPASDPAIRASVDVFEPTVAGLDFELLQATRIDVKPDAIVMLGGMLKRGPNEVAISGQLPFDRQALQFNAEGPVAFDARVAELPLQVLLELADELTTQGAASTPEESFWKQSEAEGLLTASLGVSGKLKEPEVRGGIYIEPGATFRLAGWPETSRVEDIALDAILGPSPTGAGSMIEALNARGRLQDTRFSLAGRVELSHYAPDELLQNRIDEITVTAQAERQRLPGGTRIRDLDTVIKAFTDPTGWHVVRVEKADAKLGRGEVRLTGDALIDTVSLDRLGHIPCNLRLDMYRAGLSYDKLLKRAQIDGVIAARKFASPTGRPLPAWFLAKRPEGGPADPAAPVRIASLPAGGEPGRGRLEVTRATIGLPTKKKTEEPEAPAGLPPEAGAGFVIYGLPSTFPAPEMDVSVAIGHDVAVDTLVVKADVVPNREAITLTGTPQAPHLTASAELRRGSLRLPRGDLSVPGAGADITIQPAVGLAGTRSGRRELELSGRIWGSAEGTVSAAVDEAGRTVPVRVKVAVSGGLPPAHVVEVSSAPELSDTEIYELLAFGPLKPGAQVGPERETPIQEMLAEMVAQRVFRGVLEPLEEELSQALGLEEFEVTVGLDQAVGFRVGKYIVEDLLVSYERTAGGPQDEFDLRLSYNIRDRYQVTYQTDEQERQQVNVEYRWQF